MDYRNLADLFERQAQRLSERVALRYKRHGLFHDLTWRDYREQVAACAAGLVEVGIQPGERVGLLAENRVEWLIADLGIAAVGGVNVPPHAPLTAAQIQYQLAHTDTCWLFLSSAAQLEKIRAVQVELPKLRGIVAFDRIPANDVVDWQTFLQRGRSALGQVQAELERRRNALTRDDLATIMYTSGTTGNPKGVMLTHGNLLSNALSFYQAFPGRPDAVALNWLPFSHIYARTVDHYLSLVNQAVLCLAESPDTLVQNLAETQPTNLSSVPRFYEKVLAAVAGPTQEESRKRLRGIFGGRVDWLGSGGAPLPLAIAEAFKDAGLLLLQGYGLTESAPVISFNRPAAYKLESVGQAIPGVEVKIASDGEVLSRGPHIMKGYWREPEATAEAVREGWLHTGDLGRLDADGFLYITGRKKELLVLSSGKKVVPNFIEGLLLADPCIDQVVVCGEGRNFLAALIVPHWANLRQALREAKVADPDANDEALAAHPQVYAWLAERLQERLRDVSPWEQLKKFVLLPRPFSVAAEEMTVSLKLRRSVILSHHAQVVDELYSQAPP
jgi:long-chain acyl-CoA synthetase